MDRCRSTNLILLLAGFSVSLVDRICSCTPFGIRLFDGGHVTTNWHGAALHTSCPHRKSNHNELLLMVLAFELIRLILIHVEFNGEKMNLLKFGLVEIEMKQNKLF